MGIMWCVYFVEQIAWLHYQQAKMLLFPVVHVRILSLTSSGVKNPGLAAMGHLA